MDKLTEAELAVLPEWISSILTSSEDNPNYKPGRVGVRILIKKLARALAPQPCGHPGACIINGPCLTLPTQFIPPEFAKLAEHGFGPRPANSCRWCADLDAVKMVRGAMSEVISECQTERDGWHKSSDALRRLCDTLRRANDKHKAERDALREKLKALEDVVLDDSSS